MSLGSWCDRDSLVLEPRKSLGVLGEGTCRPEELDTPISEAVDRAVHSETHCREGLEGIFLFRDFVKCEYFPRDNLRAPGLWPQSLNQAVTLAERDRQTAALSRGRRAAGCVSHRLLPAARRVGLTCPSLRRRQRGVGMGLGPLVPRPHCPSSRTGGHCGRIQVESPWGTDAVEPDGAGASEYQGHGHDGPVCLPTCAGPQAGGLTPGSSAESFMS